jgi:hypothetical protein
VHVDLAATAMAWFLDTIVPDVPGRRWRRANTVFVPRSTELHPFVGYRSAAGDNSTDGHIAVPFSFLLALADVPLYIVIGGTTVTSNYIPQGGHPSGSQATISACFLRARKLADCRLTSLPPLTVGPTTTDMLIHCTILYADDGRTFIPVLRPHLDGGASRARGELILRELYDPTGPVTGLPLYEPPITIELVSTDELFLGADIATLSGTRLVARHVLPGRHQMLRQMKSPNFRLVPYNSFGRADAASGYVLGFLAYAESLCSEEEHATESVLATFLEFALAGWPLRTVVDAVTARSQRTAVPAAYSRALEALAAFKVRRVLPPDLLGVLRHQLATIVAHT